MLVAVVALAWLALYVSLYFVYHKPFDAMAASGFLHRVFEIISASLILVVAGGLGAKIAPKISRRHLYSAALQAALGLGILGSAYLVVGWYLAASWLTCAAVLLLVGVAFWKHCLSWLRTLRHGVAAVQPQSRLGKAAALGVGVVIACGLLTALAPPLKFDALVYHLALPKQYLALGRVAYSQPEWFWGMPQLGEMLYTMSMALAGERAAAVLGWGIAVLAIAGLWDWLAGWMGPQPAWVGVAALLSGSTLSTSLGVSYVDWLVILMGLVVLGALVSWHHTSQPISLVWAGMAAGFALGTKYTAGILVLGGAVVIVWRALHLRSGVSNLTRTLLLFSLSGFLWLLPWLLKNWIAVGNPFYPFLFPSSSLEEFRQSFYHLLPWGSPYDILILPFLAAVQGVEGTPGFSASIGPLLLGLAPLAVFSRIWSKPKHHPALEIALLLGLTAWIVWAFGSRLAGLLIQSRLYFAALPAAALLAGAGFRSMLAFRLPGVRLGRIAGALVLLVFAFSVYQTIELLFRQEVPQVLLGVRSDRLFREHNLGWYAPALQAVAELPPAARTLLLWEPRGHPCLPACAPDEILDRWITARRQWSSAAQILSAWRQQGYTHLLFNDLGAEFIRREDLRYTSDDWQSLQELLGSLHLVSEFGGAYRLYELER